MRFFHSRTHFRKCYRSHFGPPPREIGWQVIIQEFERTGVFTKYVGPTVRALWFWEE